MRHISARFAPLPPSSGFIEPLPSVFFPNRYTYFAPVAPLAPLAPLAPVAPVAPLAPGAPRAPLAPRAPVLFEVFTFDGITFAFAAGLAVDFLRASVFAIRVTLLRLRNDFRNVREIENEVAQIRHERQPRVSRPHVVCHHEHLGKELVDSRAK